MGAAIKYDFAQQGKVNERFFARIHSCQRLELLPTGQLEIHLKGECLTTGWLETLCVTVIMSLDGRYIRYASVASARQEDDHYVLMTYPTEVSDSRTDQLAALLETRDWRGYLISPNGTIPVSVS